MKGAFAAVSLWPGLVFAAGLEVPELGALALSRGGAFTARADDPTAVYHNPGALARLSGTQLAYNHNLVWANASFVRATSDIPHDGAPNTATVENERPFFGLGGFVAATHQVENWTFGLSVFGPSGTGHLKYPVDGGQRYLLTEFEALMAFYGVSIAWGTPTFGIGTTLQWADLISMRYRLVVDGQPGGKLNPYKSGADVEGTLDLSDRFAPTALAGVWWAPTPAWHFGLSGRVIPVTFNAKGDLSLRNVAGGETTFTPEQLTIEGSSASTEMTLPMTGRVGARYRHLKGDREIFDVELDVVYEGWSSLDTQTLNLEGQIVLFANEPAEDITIERRWRDTVSVRLGSTWQILEQLALSGGALYESGATPNNYSHLDFMSFERLGLSTGVSLSVQQLDFNLGYMHIFQEDRTVDERFGKVLQQRPVAQCPDGCDGYTGVPANAGTFQSSYDLLSFSVTARL